MKGPARSLLLCLVCVAAFLLGVGCPVALGDVGGQAAGGAMLPTAGASLSPVSSQGFQWLTGGDEARASLEAALASPEAVAERARSRTKFEGLKALEAVSLAQKTFGVGRPAWLGPSGGVAGARVERYLGEDQAAVVLPGGKRVLAQSTVPLRSAVGSGVLAPLSMSLREENGAFEPANPLVPVSIAKRPAGGVSFPYGITMIPTQAAAPEAARLVGDDVLYPDTAPDTSFVVTPIAAGGVEASWELLSEDSPSENSLRFDLPAGMRLQMSSTVPGQAEVVAEGKTVLVIPPATAVQADGVTLPVAYTVANNVLSTHVDLGGSVAYPVMVDPIVFGGYGQYGAGHWNGWKFYSNCGCINAEEQEGLLNIWTEPGPANGDYGEWYVDAPGAGKPGGARITRAWIDEMTHQPAYQSTVNAEIGGENEGTGPVWTNNGDVEGDTRPAPLVRDDGFTEDLEFCAQGAGGYWGDPNGQPLCNEEKGANYLDFLEVMGPEARTVDNYTMIYGVIVWYLDKTPPSEVTLQDLPSGWVKYGPSPTWIHAKDEGTGIAAFKVDIPPGHLNEKGEPFFAQESSCTTEAGFVGCPEETYSNAVSFSELPTGTYTLGVYAYDATGNVREESPDPHLYVDHTPPHVESLSGSLVEHASKIGAGDYTLNVGAGDGSESAPQSGVHAISIAVDGTKVDEIATSCPQPAGVPAGNCYGLTGSWTMEGERYGAGPHTITVTAKDWAGNESSETLHITSDEAAYTSLGPGAVNLQTGNFKLASTDVSIASPGATLSLTRSYESRDPSAGATGPLGPQWSLGVPDAAAVGVWQNLRSEPDGNVVATMTSGARLAFARSGGGFSSPAGYQTETLTEKPGEYALTNAAGDQTVFKHAEGEEEDLYTPAEVVQAAGAGGLNKVAYTFRKTSEGIVEPTAVIAPSPAGLECAKEFVKGCRELTFNYAEATTATGEGPEAWGDYKGHLTRAYLHAWNPKVGEMTTTTVAQYAYDSLGRLRAEWDPQVAPTLKTVYGYDSEGHVTALTAPGQQTWAFTYGTTPGDGNEGRLIKTLQAPASTSLWKGEAVANTEAPTLSGSPMLGVRMAASRGKWSGNPVAYAYRWEDCNREGRECKVIPGAVNGNYTPTSSDRGHALVGEVVATNGSGSLVASTSPSAPVTERGEVVSETKMSAPFECPHDIAPGPEGTMWFTDACDHQVGKLTASGEATAYDFPAGVCLGGITEGPDGNMWAAEECANKIAKITSKGEISEYSLPAGSHPVDIVNGPNGELWYTDYGTNRIGKMTTSGGITEYMLEMYGTEPYGIAVGADKNIWFTMWGTSMLGRITPQGSITPYYLPSGSHPYDITAGPDGNLWFTDERSSKIGKITTAGAITEYALPAESEPLGITAGPEGALRVSEAKSSKIAEVATSGAITEYPLPARSFPLDLAPAADNSHIWFTDEESNTVGKVALAEAVSEGEATAAQPGWTLEYNVPISGSGAPQKMGSSEVASWAQKDDPVNATAIIPPSESSPQGWPATGYPQATIYYLDSQERTVNVAKPAGGISTTEYNAGNDNVERTLSADNRSTALSAGSKAAEVAEHLATQSTYNSEGIELLSTVGPEHKVKLPTGEEVEARKHTAYSYDEGAPEEGGPYYLVTRTSETAQLANGEEKDRRTVIDSYAGQEGLGWKLRQATSTTTQPASINQTRVNVYDKATGAVEETRSPGGTSETVSPPEFWKAFGGEGSGGGEFRGACAVAVDGAGAVWVADHGNGRVEKFTAAGEFVGAYESSEGAFVGPCGVAVNQSTGDVYVSDSEANKIVELNGNGEQLAVFGDTGEAKERVSDPQGLAVDSKGDVWVVDLGDDKIKEFSAAGVFIREFGTKGSGPGQLEEPGSVAVSGGEVYVTDYAAHRVDEFSPTGSYLASIGGYGWERGEFDHPQGIAANPNTGDLFVSDYGREQIDEFSPNGKILAEFGASGSHDGEFDGPVGVAVSATGTVYVSDLGDSRVQAFSAPEAGGAHMAYSTQIGSDGTEEGQLKKPADAAVDGHGNVWVADYDRNRIDVFGAQGKFLGYHGSYGSEDDRFNGPVGIAINQSTGDIYVTDSGNDRVQELNSEGEFIRAFGSAGTGNGQLQDPTAIAIDSSGDIWVTDTGNDRVEEFSATGSYIASYGSKGTGDGQFEEPKGITISGGNIYVADTNNNRIQELSPTGSYIAQFGSAGDSGGQFKAPEGMATDQAGNIYIADSGNHRIQELTATGRFIQSIGSEGPSETQLYYPQGLTATTAGDLYIADTGNNRIQRWTPDTQAVHDSKIVYYSPGTEAGVEACENHPEWANLPCRTEPAAQPETEGLPALPVTSYEYNLYDEPTVTKTTSGTGTEMATRTETDEYDAAGRTLSKELTSNIGAAMPKVTYHYNEASGALEKQSAGEHTITSVYNALGQLVSYTDGNEGTSTYKYDIDGRTIEEDTPFGSQTYSYDEATGLETKLTDSAAGVFNATYDAEGRMTSETLPNGMSACYTRNSTGEATGLEYRKARSCGEGAVWFKDSVAPSIHGQWASQESSLSSESYGYDEAGRLTEVQETPAGKGCIVRLYGLDEEGNRTSLTTREPGAEGKCATEGGTAARHTYDAANRLTDEQVHYNAFGDITALPATDAGGSTLESGYYADGQVAEQRQEGVTLDYQLDPGRRPAEITTTSKTVDSALINHYSGEGASPAWTTETGAKWTRYIFGINGSLAAIQTDAEPPVLQLGNLHGDIIGTAGDEEAASKLLSSTNSTEYGVPTVGGPARYSWLGTQELPTEFPSGVAAMGARSYVPQLGRFLQPDPKAGGSANAYAYTYGNPLNESDPSGQWSLNQTSGGLSAVGSGEGEQLAGGTGIAAGAIMPAPVNAQIEAAFWASPPWDQEVAGNEEYEEYGEEWEWEEEGEYEYASYHRGGENGEQVAPTTSDLLIEQAPGEEAGSLNNGFIEAPSGPDASALMRECTQHDKLACIRYASLFGEALKAIKKGWKAVRAGLHAAWRFVNRETVSWSEFENRIKKVFGIGKEIFSLSKCAYELFYAKGPCGSP